MSEKYYYNLSTGEIEFGRRSRGMNRMGPYDSLDEARTALANARERNEAWEDDDRAWHDDDVQEEPEADAGGPG